MSLQNSGILLNPILSSGHNPVQFPDGGFGVGGRALPYTLAQSSLPVGIPSSGSIGNNGALTLTTALALTYPQIYLYFPANAIAAGSAAGFYYCVMASTTVGTIYNNLWSGIGVPVPPVTPTPFVTTGPGAYTQTTGATLDLVTIVIPAGAMGTNGVLSISAMSSQLNSAGAKVLALNFNSTVMATITLSTSASLRTYLDVWNRNNAALQIMFPGFGQGGISATALAHTTVNTAADVQLKWTGNLAVATDYLIFEAFTAVISSGSNTI